MANEITISASLDFTKGAVSAFQEKTSLLRDVAGTQIFKNVQDIGVGQENLLIGDFTASDAFIFAENVGSTTIHYRVGGLNAITLLAGDVALFRCATGTPQAISSGAGGRLMYTIIEP